MIRTKKISPNEKQSQLHLNDSREIAVTLVAEANGTIAQINSITGHTLQSAARIFDRFLPRALQD